MLERLRIQNFKSWQDTGDMAFGSLTGFFGTNSSGKSSILQFLLMLKQTVESSDRSRVLHLGDDKSYVQLGTFRDIIYKHDIKIDLDFNLSWSINNSKNEDNKRIFALKDVNTITFGGGVNFIAEQVTLSCFYYTFGQYQLEFLRAKDNQNIFDMLLHGFSTHAQPISHPKLDSTTNQQPSKFYIPPPTVDLVIDSFDNHNNPIIVIPNDLVKEFENLFLSFEYLGPLRDYPKRYYSWGGETTKSVGNRGENAVAALLSSKTNKSRIVSGTNKTLEENIAYWLKELGLIYSFEINPIIQGREVYEVRVKKTPESPEVFVTDVGFGVSQLLPVLVLLFYVPEGSTVILEQPEIHLHPAVQAGLADVFIDAIKRRKVQIILESHSEHLLQRLQRRIAEEVISQEEIKLYFTSIEEGKSKLTTLELDEYGNIGNWPAGFFGDTLGEAAAMMKAEMERRMRQQSAT